MKSDVCEHFQVNLVGNYAFFSKFVDNYFRMTFVNFLKHDYDMNRRVSELVVYVEQKTGDNGKHLLSNIGKQHSPQAVNYTLKLQRILLVKT